MEIKREGYGIYKVRSTTDPEVWYEVNTRIYFCPCKAFFIHMICKHIKEVFARIKDDSIGI